MCVCNVFSGLKLRSKVVTWCRFVFFSPTANVQQPATCRCLLQFWNKAQGHPSDLHHNEKVKFKTYGASWHEDRSGLEGEREGEEEVVQQCSEKSESCCVRENKWNPCCSNREDLVDEQKQAGCTSGAEKMEHVHLSPFLSLPPSSLSASVLLHLE